MERPGSGGSDGEMWDWKNKIGPDFGSKGENGFEGLDNKPCKEEEKIRLLSSFQAMEGREDAHHQLRKIH